MTVEADLISRLNGLVGSRVYPDIGPIDGAKPYITYQQVGGEVLSLLESAMPGLRNGRFQINVWATTRTEANDLMRQAEALLVTSTVLRAEPQAAFSTNYEPDTKLYEAFQLFSIWY